MGRRNAPRNFLGRRWHPPRQLPARNMTDQPVLILLRESAVRCPICQTRRHHVDSHFIRTRKITPAGVISAARGSPPTQKEKSPLPPHNSSTALSHHRQLPRRPS